MDRKDTFLIYKDTVMKRVTIKEGQVGIVVRKGMITEVLKSGVHWCFGDMYVKIVGAHLEYTYSSLNEIQKTFLANYLDMIEVEDDSIALMTIKGNLHRVLKPGIYAFWKEGHSFNFTICNRSNYEIKNLPLFTIDNLLMKDYIRVFRVENYEVGMLLVNGIMVKKLTAGTYQYWQNTQSIVVQKADVRVQSIDIVGQEVLTKDKVQLRLNFNVQYKMVDIEKAILQTNDYQKQLYTYAQLSIRSLVGQVTFDELMTQKVELAQEVFEILIKKAQIIGVEVLDAGLKDVILPGEIRDIINQVLIAEKKAQANGIIRREETAATRSLLNTAKLMEDNQMLFKLKEMEYIEKIAEKINSISVSGSNNVVTELKQIFTK